MRLISAGSLVRVQSGPPFGVGLDLGRGNNQNTHADTNFGCLSFIGLNTLDGLMEQFQFFEIYIQKVNLGQIMYNSLSCSGSTAARQL